MGACHPGLLAAPAAAARLPAGAAGRAAGRACAGRGRDAFAAAALGPAQAQAQARSEEHTSELQSQSNLVCRLLLEKKNENCKDIVEGEAHASDARTHRLR